MFTILLEVVVKSLDPTLDNPTCTAFVILGSSIKLPTSAAKPAFAPVNAFLAAHNLQLEPVPTLSNLAAFHKPIVANEAPVSAVPTVLFNPDNTCFPCSIAESVGSYFLGLF